MDLVLVLRFAFVNFCNSAAVVCVRACALFAIIYRHFFVFFCQQTEYFYSHGTRSSRVLFSLSLSFSALVISVPPQEVVFPQRPG